MSTTGQHPDMPHLDAVEADPAYDYAEDTPPAGEDLDTEDRIPGRRRSRWSMQPRSVVDAEDRVVPLDPDEVREDG